MSGTTTTVPVRAELTLESGKRVHFQPRMVVRAADFQLAQEYPLERTHWHHRSLHGYGTVAGLKVDARQKDADIEIRVGAGAGIDRRGRVFEIGVTHCASLADWLKTDAGKPIRDTATDDDRQIYVVAQYEQYLDSYVPLAGEACEGGEGGQGASRIRDGFTLRLTTTPPDMPLWKASLRFRELMTRVHPEAGLGTRDDREAFWAAIAALGDATALLPTTLKLDAEAAADIVMEGHHRWTRDVVPALAEPGAEDDPSIVLGRVLFRYIDGKLSLPEEQHYDSGRPFLLQTQQFQGLDLASVPAAVSGTARQVKLVTITPLETTNGGQEHVYELWFHVDEPSAHNQIIDVPQTSVLLVNESPRATGGRVVPLGELKRDGRSPNVFLVQTNLASIDVAAERLNPDTDLRYLRFFLDLTQIRLLERMPSARRPGPADASTLVDFAEERGIAYEGQLSGPGVTPSVLVFVRSALRSGNPG